jgi:hypothetical protein
MALPGSQLYKNAVMNGVTLPDTYEGYSFHGYDTVPLPTETLSAAEILAFRDKAFEEYHSYGPFQDKVKAKFGQIAVDNINEMILSGKTSEQILEIINTNTCTGMEAKLRFTEWRKC